MLIIKFRQLFLLATAISLTLLFGCKINSHSTTKAKQKNIYADSLAWINLVDSPGVNYYKLVECFDKYWEHREKPTEDDGEGKDLFGRSETKSDKEVSRPIQYVYEYKRFLNWQQRNKNLIKPDGTIMTPEELLDQWKKSVNDTITK